MSRSFIATLISCCCVLFQAAAQEYPNLVSPAKITTIGYWNNGQAATYHVTESGASFKGKSDKPYKESSSEYDIRLKVVDSTEKTYRFEMVYTNSVPDPNTKGFIKKIGELAYDVPIIYQTTELGEFDTILNLEDLQKDLMQKLELCKGFVAEEEEKEVADIYSMVLDNMAKNFQDLENVEAVYVRDIIALHGFYGFGLQLGKPLEIGLEYPTIGEILLTGTGTLTLNAINKTKDECIFSSVEKPDREELKAYMGSLALLFMMDSKKKMSMEELNMTMNTKKKLKMELSTGWMNSVVTTSTVKVSNKKGDQKKVTTLALVRK